MKSGNRSDSDISGRKSSSGLRIAQFRIKKLFLWELLQEDSECPSSALLLKMELEYGKISITIRHLNRLRASWGLSRDKGRPRKSDSLNDFCSQKNLIRVVPNLPFAGVSVFDDRMEQHEGF